MCDPEELYSQPVDLHTAQFLGLGEPFEAQRTTSKLETPFGSYQVEPGISGQVQVVVPPAAISLGDQFSAQVMKIHFNGTDYEALCRVGEVVLKTRLSQSPQVGDELRLKLDPKRVLMFETKG